MKTHIVIKLLFVSTLLFSLGCKKKSKELTTVNFHLFNPVTGEGFEGVRVWISQDKDVGTTFNQESKTELVWEGYTDANGKASHSFKCFNNNKYYYWQGVEKKFYDDPNLEFLIQPAFLPLNKNEVNEVIYKAVQKNVSFLSWFKNENCFDINDKMKYRTKSIVDVFDPWSPWYPGDNNSLYPSGFIEGCFELISPVYLQSQNIWDVEMEVTKNGVTTLIRDTFYVTGQNGIDTLKYFY